MRYSWLWRKKLRLEKYDYSSQGYYFVTICTKWRLEYFSEMKNGEVILNDFWKIVHDCWEDIIKHYQGIKLDEYIIMPNHIHGIIIVGNEYFRSDISNIIKGFKIWVTKEIRQNYGDYEFVWQKSFFDVTIKNQDQLDKTREYIILNPKKWEHDVNNPKNIPWKK